VRVVFVVLAASLLLAFPLVAGPPPPAPPPAEEIETCLTCHGEKDLSVELPSGETQTLFVDRAVFEKSVHGAKLGCTGCHPGMDEVPHKERPVKDRKEFVEGFKQQCKSCHFDNYTKALDGVHYKQLAKGDSSAPFCVDCHGAHDIARPSQPRTKVSETCATCHSEVNDTFAMSVHGKALLEKNPDVPVCTDCHRSHDIASAKSQAWRLSMVETCGKCHTNEKVMKKYGLSTNVLGSYLKDFHGMSASFYKGGKGDAKAITALCVDCHGVHDIKKVGEAGSQVLQANLQKTCQKCHANASPSFSAAWLSHYEPSWKRAPLVYAVTLFYKVFIPFVIGGLVLQILLHLWRVVVNR